MPRPPRKDTVTPGGVYHVYARGNDGMTLFHEPEDYEFYLNAMAELKTPHGIIFYHYELMPNHVHLLLRVVNMGLSAFMHILQLRLTKRFIRKTGFIGHVWQGRFKHRTIDSDAYLFACGNYIEMNPVRAGLVKDPVDWPYSSYRAYAYGQTDRLIEIDPLYPSLGRTMAERCATYRQLITQTRANPVPTVPGTGGAGVVEGVVEKFLIPVPAVPGTKIPRYQDRAIPVPAVPGTKIKHRTIDNDAYLFACGNYIEMNPVRAGLVKDPVDWPYSSYRAYAYGQMDRLIEIDPLYPSLGRTMAERCATYRQLITQTRANPDPTVPGTGGARVVKKFLIPVPAVSGTKIGVQKSRR